MLYSPGTEFMEKLNEALFNYVNRDQGAGVGGGGEIGTVKYVLNDSSVPGEGEHKIVNYIRENREFFSGNSACNIIISWS